MRKFSMLMILAVILLVWAPLRADEPPKPVYESAQAFLDTLHYEQGTIELPDGIATLDVPDGFSYIGPEDSKRFLEEGWGNPDGSGQIGMLLPTDSELFGESGWAVVISYQEDGYVSDKDANKIDYDDLLESMQVSTRKRNKQRTAHGFEPVTLVGWAATPYYDNEAKKLYWAKELKVGQEENHTLNYNVRILGRKGVLVMNAVSAMEQLPMIKDRMEQVIAFADFNDGYRYSDFNPGVDKMAAYGIAALIGGKMALKAGLLAKLGGLLLAFKKIIIIGFLAVAGLFSKLFRRRKPSTPA
jgi:uncharacterized membrane-anchored protein